MIPVVITTINPPSLAIEKLLALKCFHLVVVGDKKTPPVWKNADNLSYLSLAQQLELPYKTANLLPINHYGRKNIGYLYAYHNFNHGYIYETDDDNIIKENHWQFDTTIAGKLVSNCGFVNVYRYFTEEYIWPRGLPFDKVNATPILETKPLKGEQIGVVQGLADKDPDIDAVCRMMLNNREIYFEHKESLVLAKGAVCPINTQNTAVARELMPLMYLPVTVEFRFTDILRGIVLQVVAWQFGYHVKFQAANVVQDRNIHNLYEDLKDEFSMYLNTNTVLEIAVQCASANTNMSGNIYNIYSQLQKQAIIQSSELKILEAYLYDLS